MASSLENSGAFALTNICYRQIKGNYFYGIFGEFQLVVDIR